MTAPIIVTAQFGPADQRALDRLRAAHFPPERNHLHAHLTLFHHLPPSLAREVTARLRTITATPRPAALIDRLLPLGGGVALHVRSPALEAIRAALVEAFVGCLTPQDQAGWRPHVTIQNKVSPETARALLATLSARFEPRPLAIVALAAWHYRGGPWEPLSRHAFRG